MRQCHNREQNCKCPCGSVPCMGCDPHKCSAMHFPPSVLPLYAVCLGGLKCASDSDVNRRGSLSSLLAAADVVCQSSAAWFSVVNQVLKQLLHFFLVLNKSLHSCDTGVWSLNCLFSLRYAADTVQGQSSAFAV